MGHRTGEHHYAHDRHSEKLGWKYWQRMDHIPVGLGPLTQSMGNGQKAHGSHPDALKGDGMADPV
eukprot:571186-Karenia_brevis.AAC.1